MQSDSPIFETPQRGGREDRSVLLRLSGEIDVLYQKLLEDTLSDCLASERPTLVDLSGVTFIDSRCVRELAVFYQLGDGRVALCDPSREVELGVAACDLEDWIDFVYTTQGNPPEDAAASVLHEVAIRSKKGVGPCARHTRR
jgi:anti-anti-sigma factor